MQYHPGAKPTTTYGRGCRAGDGCSCAEHHAADTTAAKRRKAEAAFPPAVRQQLLADVAAGIALDAALRRVGVSHQRLWVWARILEGFGRALDEALTSGRDPGISHGSEHSYRVHACRCPDCRAAKARYRVPAQPVGASR
ncbi:hypothetical protein [Streptomyces sp. NPDC055912]|uniref:hypothetical protein n=1 Tax=Streptomyces sp. NPDC055912 TaxID=3345660 RepID=UPI0035E101D4